MLIVQSQPELHEELWYMDIKNMVASTGINPQIGLKILPIMILALIWIWILLVVLILGFSTTTFNTLFGWTAMIPSGF